MKYKRMALAACALLLLLSATNLSAVLTDEHPRYHQHLERPAYTPCAEHDGETLCTHLPLVLIDTGGAEIPGVPIQSGGSGREDDAFTTTADGSTLLRASVSVMDHAEGNNHPADTPTLQSVIDIRVRGNSSRYFDKHSYLVKTLTDDGAASRDVAMLGMDAFDEWALHGPYLDKTLIRNYMWYNLAGEIMDYAPNVRFCEVLLNGVYQGLYVMTETVSSGADARLKLTEPSKDTVQTSYALRLDRGSGNEVKNIETFSQYALRRHHTMPVVISEFGVSTGRGMAQIDRNTGRNQGHMSEQEQGQALVDCWRDITAANCAGGCVFTWQDEWFKRTWNTMHAVNLQRTPYWSDYQTNEQYFGLLSFDPGEEESVCYVDGDLSEWTEEDKLFDTGTRALSMKYDEKFIYLLAYEKGFANGQKTLYIPIDTTPKTGSTYCENFGLRFEDPVDFVLAIDGRDNSRLLVQERYEVLRAMFYHETHDADAYLDPPDADTPLFKPIELMLQTATPLLTGNWQASSETYETGDLAYGNANPAAPDYDSLADFIFAGDYVELKLPWQLLNFSDPSRMTIHDDYYENYGVDYITIDTMYLGLTDGAAQERTPLYPAALKGWGNTVSYHERLKPSYYILQKLWQ